MDTVSEADIARSRVDPRFKQILLARVLEQLLGSLHRLQAASVHLDPAARAICAKAPWWRCRSPT